ncbi:anti-sigma B factor RsbW [Priestia aryabhattai]|uniref:anti-sigma B factor RsbW n=1 Tax=Bacillaceae TaxID=186817 RepID=UPI000BA15799|nr:MULTISPECIES: anti-sigma B factor RsbW [Bacillaceae]MBY6024573.1 anti-sigma B factor RsbW [Nitratireductor sp. DP7N14-4]OZT10867.1 anti-sigma B factor RsbW [Priestia aryabhattai]USY55354.1 anti-sigma B factor RsbW [Bacillus sp. 1780r2a1]MDT2048597.1 anti-sigma B factor RsbW [Priestia flexa]TDB48002.1 anti-sigma B factor RsbW [Bacillus sp. CBEL-1]
MKQPYDFVEMKIPAKPDYVAIIRLTLSGVANRMGFSYDDIEDMKIAISEACTNAVQHAYKENENGEVKVGFGLFSDRLEIMVVDKGESFDFEELKEKIGPYETAEEVEMLPEGGLGLYLIETLMDEVKMMNSKGVTLMMTKYLQREQVESDENTVSTYEIN